MTWLTYTGRNMEDEISDGWINDISPDDKATFLSIYNKAFEGKEPFNIDYRLRRHDGIYRWVKAIGRPTFSPDGGFSGFVGICTEIHEAKLLQEELERNVSKRTFDLLQVNKELKKSNAELQQFAYVASHDLQEPLRKTLFFSDRLMSIQDLPAAVQSYIEKICESSRRMSQLINDLLDFSRATRMEGQFVPTDLNQVVASMIKDFDLKIKDKHAVIEVGWLPTIEAIPLQMGQLFHNLMSNALKFAKETTPPVIHIKGRIMTNDEISAFESLEKNTEYAEIVLEDNGIGFSNEFAEQIFVLFQRLNGRHQYLGTGIGLALCRKIVDNHGGKIFATSIEFIHTEFHVILPVKQMPGRKRDVPT